MSEEGNKGQEQYRIWKTRIDDAMRRERKYLEQGKRVVQLYEGEKAEETPFSILYSNTETLTPAVYNARPIPMVDRRFKDEDPVGKLSAEAGTRLLKFLIDAESEEYDTFDELMGASVLDAVVTNRGLTRFKYVADTSENRVKNELVLGEAVRWDKFSHGHARTWKKVPWICFEWDMDKAEVEANFPDADPAKLNFDQASDDENKSQDSNSTAGVSLAKVWEIWDKKTKKVYFISPCYQDGYLKVVDDPLKLSGFFPIPKPLNFMRKITSLIPTPLYIQYEQQAKELNEVTTRLRAIIKALKVRGFYDSTIEGIDKVLEAEDNTMVPVENRASMPEGMGMDKMLWIMPLGELATVAQQLYQNREQLKQVIYEITGISDILRGASVASETATAQNIKNQWGTLRLKKAQKEVQRYCRDALRIILEIAVTRFDVKTIAAMTGLPYPTQDMQISAKGQIQQLFAQSAQMTPPGQQPQPPEIPPQLKQIMNSPTWEQVLAVLRDDTTRSYRVDIETNSTIDAEAAQDKQDIAELLSALSQFLNGLAPLIEKGVMSFEVAKGMLLTIARRYTFGPQLEDAIAQMNPPPPPPENQPDPADQVKLQVAQEQAKVDSAQAQADMQRIQLEGQIAMQELQGKKELMVLEMEIKRQELEIKRSELGLQAQGLQMKNEAAKEQHRIKLETLKQKAIQPAGGSNAAV